MNKKVCEKCKYRGVFIGNKSIHCYYAGLTSETCLKLVDKKVIDRRGNDPNNCLLFEEGEAMENEEFKYGSERYRQKARKR